jgi:hypothetical protein
MVAAMEASNTKIVVPVASPKFPAGQIVITRNAADRLSQAEIAEGLARHLFGDWGDLVPEDMRSNDDALIRGNRLLSAYGKGNGRFWIISEWDRSVTTVLLPEDY